MKNKAFTLIELLAVIVILGLLATITIPNIINSIKISSEKAYDRQVRLIEEAAERWTVDNPEKLSEKMHYKIANIKIVDLQTEGYLDKNLNNPITKNKMDGCVTITKNDNNGNIYNYKYNEIDECQSDDE